MTRSFFIQATNLQAFTTPFPIPSANKRTQSLVPQRTHLSPTQNYLPPKRVSETGALSLQAAARGGVDPRDEAFITCPLCGSDELISASRILNKGSIPVRCSQCNNRFTALAENAITQTGKKLGLSESEQEEGEVVQNIVKLYVSGLGPKTDSIALKTVMEEFGEVLSANVVYDKVTGRSRGFGFVTIVGRSAAAAAMDVLSGDSKRFGRRLNVREAIDR